MSQDTFFSEAESEGKTDYRRGGYHPVHIGELFNNSRYIVAQKLGWGHFSTVWLGWDFEEERIVALKIQKSEKKYTDAALEEIEFLERLNRHDKDGTKHCVRLFDHFKLRGPNGTHICIVFEPLSESLLALIFKFEDGIPLGISKRILDQILIATDYMHHELGMINTDIKPENVLLMPDKETMDRMKRRIDYVIENKDDEAFKLAHSAPLSKSKKRRMKKRRLEKRRSEDKEDTHKEPKSQAELSRQEDFTDFVPMEDESKKKFTRAELEEKYSKINVKLVDFGNACYTNHRVTSIIQTRQYRAPEVLLGVRFTETTDIWSIACMFFEMLTADYLFEPRESRSHRYDKDEDHLAQIIELLGQFPLNFFLQNGRSYHRYFNKWGELLRIRSLHFWTLRNVLEEKYHFNPINASDIAEIMQPRL